MSGTEFEKLVMNRCGGIFKLLWNPGIDSASLCSLAGRYDNPIPTHFLAPVDCSKIPALISDGGRFKPAFAERDKRQ